MSRPGRVRARSPQSRLDLGARGGVGERAAARAAGSAAHRRRSHPRSPARRGTQASLRAGARWPGRQRGGQRTGRSSRGAHRPGSAIPSAAERRDDGAGQLGPAPRPRPGHGAAAACRRASSRPARRTRRDRVDLSLARLRVDLRSRRKTIGDSSSGSRPASSTTGAFSRSVGTDPSAGVRRRRPTAARKSSSSAECPGRARVDVVGAQRDSRANLA